MFRISESGTGTPYILKRIELKQSSFLLNYHKCSVITFEEFGPSSNSISFKKINAIKAALGEHLERISVFVNNKRFMKQSIKGFELVTESEVEIPLYRVFLNWGIPLLDKVDLTNIKSDTTGLASHLNSFDSIQSAFLEFFERQSLLYTWFTRLPGKKIRLDSLLQDDEIRRQVQMAYLHVDEVYFFNISLSNKVKVIMSLAVGRHTKGVGICAAWNERDAVLGSIKELFQCITFNHNKRSLDIEGDIEEDPLYYSKHFISQVTAKQLKEEFKYLISSSEEYDFDPEDNPFPSSELIPIMKEIASDLEIDLIICHIPQLIEGINTKIVKVLTTKGFHHIYASKIDPYSVHLLKKHKNNGYYNLGKMVPFG